MNEIVNKVAQCEYYAYIYEEYPDVSRSSISIEKSLDALSDFYAAVFIFIVKAKIYFSDLRSKLTAGEKKKKSCIVLTECLRTLETG